VMCFRHVACEYVFRARLEDLKEIEFTRFSGKTFKATSPMTWGHAASLFHAATNVLRTLGWAWRWAEWWVDGGDNWEPLLEPGQVEENMTEEELRIVHSSPESRAEDARRCRLAAFGAALRNRNYDDKEGDDGEPLERALTAVISTRSLVGPLKKKEVEFFVTWLSLAYRSKSPVLGFGDDKTPVASDGFCNHKDDNSPKYELGPTRPLPGKARSDKSVFEPRVNEPDDFLKFPASMSPAHKSKKIRKKKKKEKDDDDDDYKVPLKKKEKDDDDDDYKLPPSNEKKKEDEDNHDDKAPPKKKKKQGENHDYYKIPPKKKKKKKKKDDDDDHYKVPLDDKVNEGADSEK